MILMSARDMENNKRQANVAQIEKHGEEMPIRTFNLDLKPCQIICEPQIHSLFPRVAGEVRHIRM